MEDVVAAAGGRVPTSICCGFRGIETEAGLYIHLLADGSASCALATETSQGRVHGLALPQPVTSTVPFPLMVAPSAICAARIKLRQSSVPSAHQTYTKLRGLQPALALPA